MSKLKYKNTSQIGKVWNLMKDRKYRSLSEIEKLTKIPQANISAILRKFRTPTHGNYTVSKRKTNDKKRGMYEYRVHKVYKTKTATAKA